MARSGLFTSWKLSSAFYFIKSVKISHYFVKYGKDGIYNSHINNLRGFASFSKINYNVPESQQESESDSDHDNQNFSDVTDLKLQILKASLNFVPEHGWNKKSIAFGADSLGISSASHTLIEDGGADLVHYFNFLCNEKLEAHLKENQPLNESKKDIQNFIGDALEHRLQMVIPYVDKWPEAMALMVSPKQFPVDLKILLDLMDTIWYHSGDQSLNLTWYSKRLSLAMAYRACELSLIQDKSTDFSDTFGFLQRRVENVMDTNKFINQVVDGTKDLPAFASGTLITARNLLGLNRWFR